MKNQILSILLCVITLVSIAQEQKNTEKLFVNKDITTHFILSEPISYTDISTKLVKGDQPEPNILRIKPSEGEYSNEQFMGIVSIVCETYMAQYELIYSDASKATKNIKINSNKAISINNTNISMSAPEMREFCLMALKEKPSYNSVKTKENKLEIKLNNIYTIDDYFFVDLSFRNKTNIQYSVDQIRFKIEDKRKVKRSNFQEIEIHPEHKLYNTQDFKKKHRNIFVFKKFTFPEQKIFSIEIAEDQISGRTVKLEIDYSDVLNADTL